VLVVAACTHEPPPASSVTIAEIAPSASAPAPTPTMSASAVATTTSMDGPHGHETIGAVALTTGNVPNAEVAVAKLRPGFRSCYNRGLASDPTMKGTLVLDVAVAANGDVSGVARVSGAGLSPEVELCLIKKTRNAAFDAPGGNGTTLRVHVSFVTPPR